jgi:hypothetical protein
MGGLVRVLVGDLTTVLDWYATQPVRNSVSPRLVLTNLYVRSARIVFVVLPAASIASRIFFVAGSTEGAVVAAGLVVAVEHAGSEAGCVVGVWPAHAEKSKLSVAHVTNSFIAQDSS